MIRKFKAILLLLSFTMVLFHMMVPHHHHESLAEAESAHHQNVSHTHHHGSHHHHHDHENEDSNSRDNNQNLPQHFHFSTSDNFEMLRINKVAREINEPAHSALAIIYVFSWDPKDLYDNLNHPTNWPAKSAISQFKPGANGLRAPPSIV